MAEARRRDQWEHTSCMMAMWSDGKEPEDFNPFVIAERGRRVPITPDRAAQILERNARKRAEKQAQ